ncbi:MAG: S-layer homology domain-containing protein [Defluviitaleaceae bacterium]|nr:S-layer homology domain-containing protein [Defluviitaleaceae bacterium]
MKKFFKMAIFMTLIFVFLAQTITVYARMGGMGFFGGISQGVRLPKTTETIIANAAGRGTAAQVTTLQYKEVVFLTGTPTTFVGTIEVRHGQIPAGQNFGTFQETYTIRPSSLTNPSDAIINRQIVFNVNFRVHGSQIIKDYQVARWTETITVGGTTFTLDPLQSHFGLSIIMDNAPGVTYYKGNVSQRSVYVMGSGENSSVVINETISAFYGYNSAWSATETHRVNGTVITDGWQMTYQVRPSVSVNKELQYSRNEPQAISFAGNYRELLQSQSGLRYDIISQPRQFHNVPRSGGVSIASHNSFEQLPAPNVEFLRGHPAQSDIERLFAMNIVRGEPRHFRPEQAITRGQFVAAVSRAIKLPIEQPQQPVRGRGAPSLNIVFPDVQPNRPEYQYIMAAYRAGLAVGRTGGNFFADSTIERQEAIVILLRTLGLENLALDPTPQTVFTDDAQVASWARRELAAAERIGLITADENGRIHPRTVVSNAEAAALINRLIEYMRVDLARDYVNIVNFGD